MVEGYIDGKSYDGKIYRGLSTKKPLDIVPGDVINQCGTSSWSKDLSTAKKFSGGIRPNHYIFIMDGGTKMGADISKWSAHPEEKEVTLSKKSLQEVVSVEEKDGITYVHLKEVYE